MGHPLLGDVATVDIIDVRPPYMSLFDPPPLPELFGVCAFPFGANFIWPHSFASIARNFAPATPSHPAFDVQWEVSLCPTDCFCIFGVVERSFQDVLFLIIGPRVSAILRTTRLPPSFPFDDPCFPPNFFLQAQARTFRLLLSTYTLFFWLLPSRSFVSLHLSPSILSSGFPWNACPSAHALQKTIFHGGAHLASSSPTHFSQTAPVDSLSPQQRLLPSF